jgi:putative hydrolase of the HAD superfamily
VTRGSKVRAIIFDIGRVLVRVDIRQAQVGLANGLRLSPEELWSAIENDPHWRDWQEGRMSPQDWHLNLSKRLGLSLDFEKFTNVWNSALDPVPILSNELFDGLAKHYRLGLLSNTDPIHVARLESTYDFFRYFAKPVRIYSCVVGASKPDPLIFREALKACNVRAEEAVYIDDIPAYAEAARRLGMSGIQFQSPEQLRQDLVALGVETPPVRTT